MLYAQISKPYLYMAYFVTENDLRLQIVGLYFTFNKTFTSVGSIILVSSLCYLFSYDFDMSHLFSW